MAEYIVHYAEFVNVVNAKTINKFENADEDAKFYFIDAYTRVVVRAFNNLDKEPVLIVAKNTKNIEYMINVCNSKQFNLVEKSFEVDAYKFIENYLKCDKDEFCDRISVKVESMSPTSSVTDKALYYFNAIYGV